MQFLLIPSEVEIRHSWSIYALRSETEKWRESLWHGVRIFGTVAVLAQSDIHDVLSFTLLLARLTLRSTCVLDMVFSRFRFLLQPLSHGFG